MSLEPTGLPPLAGERSLAMPAPENKFESSTRATKTPPLSRLRGQ